MAVKSQFNEKLPVALGLLSAGNGAGILAMSPVIQLLLDNFGLRDTYRILAGLMGLWSSLGFGVNTRKSSENNRRQRVKDNEDEDISEASLSRCQYVLKTVFISPEFTIYTLSVAAVDTVGLVTCFVHMVSRTPFSNTKITGRNLKQVLPTGKLNTVFLSLTITLTTTTTTTMTTITTTITITTTTTITNVNERERDCA